MFTGIIEAVGKIEQIEKEGTGVHLLVSSPFSKELRPDESVSHNGVCLTVTRLEGGAHWVTAVRETLERSNLSELRIGSLINLERSLPVSGRLDGHFVQGHIDQTGIVTQIKDENGSWLFSFEYDSSRGHITVEKGSIAVNGVSLTCFASTASGFSVAVIPHTYHHTNFSNLSKGSRVNIEFDILGKYVSRLLRK